MSELKEIQDIETEAALDKAIHLQEDLLRQAYAVKSQGDAVIAQISQELGKLWGLKILLNGKDKL